MGINSLFRFLGGFSYILNIIAITLISILTEAIKYHIGYFKPQLENGTIFILFMTYLYITSLGSLMFKRDFTE